MGDGLVKNKNLSEDKQLLLKKWLSTTPKKPELCKQTYKNILSLSFAQQRIWFLEQLVPNTPLFNICYAIHIKGTLNVQALEKAWCNIVQRHEALRTEFIIQDTIPVQQIVPPQPIYFLHFDFRFYPDGEKQQTAIDYIEQESRKAIPLNYFPLHKAILIKLDPNWHLFGLIIHHIIADGWSLNVIQRELIMYYQLYTSGQEILLPPQHLQYADYTLWQREQVKSKPYQDQLKYWEAQLKDLSTPVSLPYDKQCPSSPSYHGKRHYFSIDSILVSRLKKIAINSKSTLYAILLTSLSILLFRYTRKSDLVIGCPIANRNNTQYENIIGFFVNALAIRVHVEETLLLQELINEVTKTLLRAYENQDIPFEVIVQTINPTRNLSMSPLFAVGFVLQNFQTPTEKPNDLQVEPITIYSGIAQIDLLLSLTEIEGELMGFFEYSTDLYEHSSIEYLSAHFLQLIESMSENINHPVNRLNLLSQHEKIKLLSLFSQNQSFATSECLHERFEKIVDVAPHSPAITDNDKTITYGQLNDFANQLAIILEKRSGLDEQFIGIYLERSANIIIAILAILKLGAAYVPLDPIWPEQRINDIRADLGLRIVVTQRALLEKLPNEFEKVCLDELLDAEKTVANLKRVIKPESLAYIIYTSGSTGKPKGVQIEHRNVTRLFDATHEIFTFNRDDVWSQFHSCVFDFSVWEIWGALLTGARLVIVPQEITRSPYEFYQLICKENVTMLSQTPSAFKHLLDHYDNKNKPNSLRYIMLGGEKLDTDLAKLWFEKKGDTFSRVINMYGITETTVHVTHHELNPNSLNQSVIGRPISDLSLYLLDDNLELTPRGMIGEIYVGGAGVSRGYYHREELSKKVFIPDFFHPENPQNKLYKTGDLGRLNTQGELIYIGRADQQVKIRGHRIELGEIEHCLKSHDQIQDALVCYKQDAINTNYLVGYYIPKWNSETLAMQQLETCQHWEKVFDRTYTDNSSLYQEELNFIGWNSLYNNKPIPLNEMHEWLDNALDNIINCHPQNILEIGCGTGLIAYGIKSYCQRYLGVDISLEAIEKLQKNFISDSKFSFKQLAANNLCEIERHYYDTIILNSVVQYFPSIDYLTQVLHECINIIKPGGSIYIGDVRDLTLLKDFYFDLERHHGDENTTFESLMIAVQSHIDKEHELIINPSFFKQFKNSVPEVSAVHIKLKKGQLINELNRFRYDVIFKIKDNTCKKKPFEIEWEDFKINEKLSLDAKEALLIKNIPNLRLKQFNSNNTQTSIDPNQLMLWSMQQGCDYELYASAHDKYCFNVLLYYRDNNNSSLNYVVEFNSTVINRAEPFANIPNANKRNNDFNEVLKAYLRTKLPNYMVPKSLVAVSHFPLTVNGKIDFKSLPSPSRERPSLKNSYQAPSTPLEQQLVTMWSQLLQINKVGTTDSFFELGGHSLLAAQFIFMLESELQLTVPLQHLFQVPTIEWLAKKIEILKSGLETENNIVNDFYHDAALYLNIRKTPKENIVNPPDCILLTGATGFFGSFILHSLLEKTDSSIICLVRANTAEQAYDRIYSKLSKHYSGSKTIKDRVKIILGDFSKTQFGLSDSSYNQLVDVDAVFHNGCMVNFVMPYIALKSANVDGTQEIIKLCNYGRQKLLHYVSTTHVFTQADAIDNIFYESTLPNHPHLLGSGYTQSKWTAEKMILNAIDAGLAARIYRFGRLWGDSVTGYCQENDFLWLIIKASITLAKAPDLKCTLDILPANFASDLFCQLTMLKNNQGPVYHLTNPSSIEWQALVNNLRNYGYSIEFVPYKVWRQNLIDYTQANNDEVGKKILPLLNAEFEESLLLPLQVDCDRTITSLPLFDWSQVQINKCLITNYLNYFNSIGYLSSR